VVVESAMPMIGARKLKLGVAGLGRGFTLMLPTLAQDPRIALTAAADPRPEARALFATEFNAQTYLSVEELCRDPSVEVVYVATPHQVHAAHTAVATAGGKHVLVEKPMAISLAECQAMISAADKAGVHLIVGHSHSFDAPIALTRKLIDSGEFGAVQMITAINYTDFMRRPRRSEELDTSQGGGVIFSQAAHQVDIVRLLAGSRAKSVRAVAGRWDASRPTEGAYGCLLNFEDGLYATLTYSGYGQFDSDELQGWIGEMGRKKQPGLRATRRFDSAGEEATFKQAANYGGANYRPPAEPDAHQNFGTVIVSCECADLRPLPNGVAIYRNGDMQLDALPAPPIPRVEVIDELYDAIVNGIAPHHDGRWAMATLEVCLAMLQSSRAGREIELQHQG
jgi:phthalate 4,5-cis-dihydrodiol dehydrogenase